MGLTEDIKSQAQNLGFDMARVTRPAEPGHAQAFAAWLAAGMQGEMGYLVQRAEHHHAGGKLQSRPAAGDVA